MKDIFEAFSSEIKVLDKNLKFFEERSNLSDLPYLEELICRLEELEDAFNLQLYKLSLYKEINVFKTNYYSYRCIDEDYLEERNAIKKCIFETEKNFSESMRKSFSDISDVKAEDGKLMVKDLKKMVINFLDMDYRCLILKMAYYK